MKNFKYILLALMGLSLAACEDVIEIDLNEAEQQFVIEAHIQTNTGICEVSITKSRTFYEDNTFETVGQASVELLLPDGGKLSLPEQDPGLYSAVGIVAEPGKTYQLNILMANGQSFSASTVAPFPVLIDSVEIDEHPFPEDENDEPLIVTCVAKDPVGQANFYRMKFTLNGEYDPYQYILQDDEITIDDEIRMGAFDEVFPGDTVRIEFISMDKASYKYFDKVSQISQNDGGGNIVPFNPTANFGEGVLGFFGIYTSDYRTVVIP